jgi:large repetitive protein
MRKRGVCTFLVLLLLLFQIAYPIGNVFAAASGILLPPSNLAYQQTSPDDGNLVWSSVYGATGYNVYEIKDGSLNLLGTAKTNSYSLSNLAEGNYSYVVSTLSADGESGPCAPVDVTIAYPTMAAPATLTNTIQNGNDMVLSWGASQYAENYKVYQLLDDGTKKLLTTTSSRSYTVVNAAEGAYSFAVSTANSLYGESSLSSPSNVNVVFPVINEPTNLSFSLSNGNDINLKWQASSYANSYKIYKVIDGQEVYQTSVTTTNVKFVNMPDGDYTYKVYSISDRFGTSAKGSSIDLTVSPITMVPPSSVTYKVQNLNDIVLTWTSAANTESYNVYQVIDGLRVLKSTVTSTSTTFTNMPAGDYTYEITSNNSRFGESEAGTNVSLTLDPVVMGTPSGFDYKITNGNDISLSWSPVTNATNYRVYQIVNGQKVLKSTVTGTSLSYANMPGGDYTYEVYSYNSRFGESSEGASTSFSLVLPVMAAPDNGSWSIVSPTSFTLSWDVSAYATSYKVYQIVNGTKTLKNTISGTKITYNSMAPGTYTYEIHSYSSRFGESKDGTPISVTLTGQTMGTPTNPTYTILNGNDVKLSWNPVQYATNYKIYQVVDGIWNLVSTVSGTSVTYTNQLEGDYTFVVDSYYSLLGESPQGAEIDFSLVYPTMQKPNNLTGPITNLSDIALKWDSVPFATSYKVYEIIDGVEVLKNTVTSTSLTFSKVSEGTHSYVVRSYSSRFNESQEGSRVDLTVTYPELQAPANVTYTIGNGNDITLKWASAEYATGYNIYQIIDGQRVFKKFVSGTTVTFTNMPEGDYSYEVSTVSDRFGESAGTNGTSLSVVFPAMQAPANFTNTIKNGNDIYLIWGAASYATAYKVYQVVDGEKSLIKTVTGTNTTLTNMPEGDYQYEVHSYSDRFGESADGTQQSFTLVFPIMQAPTASYSITNGNDIVLKWTASTYATAYKVYQVENGEKTLIKTTTSTSYTLTNMPEGNYSYEVHSYSDRFGESPAGSKVDFQLTWPVVQPPVLQGTIVNANNVTLTWNSVTWANEYRVYEVKGDTKDLIYKGSALTYKIYNLTEEMHSYQVTAYSTRFGESVLSNLVAENIIYPEMQQPEVTVKVTGPSSAQVSWNFVTFANGYNVYEIVDGVPVLLVKNLNNLSYTFTNLSYKNHEFYVTSNSNSFGESKPSNTVLAKLITDTEPPVTTSSASSDWTNNSQTIQLTASDNDSGVAHTYYSINDGSFVEGTSVTVDQEGMNKVSFYSVDKVGNAEAAKTVYSLIDQTAPVTTLDQAPGAFIQSYTGNLNATDAASGIRHTYYSINGSDYVEGTSFTIDQEGVNKVSFYSVDMAGNKEAEKTVEVDIDRTAPVTESDAPADWVKEGVQVNLSSQDKQSGVAGTYYSINGSEYVEGTMFTVDQEGVNKVSYYSVDQAGNIEDVKTVEVKIDKTAPVTTSDAPVGWVKDDAQVTLTAEDKQSGVLQTFYSLNGSDYLEGTSLTVSQEGVNQVSYYSVDQVGNKEETKTIEVKVDKTAPETKSDAPQAWAKENVQVNLSSEDSQSGVAKTYYSLNGTDYVEGTNFVVSQEGVNQISFYSVDQAGNVEQTKTIEVKIDKTAPTITSNVKDFYGWGSKLNLSYTSQDVLSGVTNEVVLLKSPRDLIGKVVNPLNPIYLFLPGNYTLTILATDAAGNTRTLEKKFTVYIPVCIDITPGVIKGNKGEFTARVELPRDFDDYQFDLNTAELNGVKALKSNSGYYNQAKKGQFKFERSSFQWNAGEQELEFRCYLYGYLVIGHTKVQVKN